MSVELPWSRIASLTVRPRLFSGTQEGTLGGPDLPVPRLGDRFGADIETTQLRQDSAARTLIAALTEAGTADARIVIHEPDLPRPSSVGPLVTVAGANQSGTSIALRGARRGAQIVRRKYLTIVHGGVGFLYMATADVRVGPGGTVVVPIWPMLRTLTVDGEPCIVDRPYIEGRLTGFVGAKWIRNRIEPLTIAIEERA